MEKGLNRIITDIYFSKKLVINTVLATEEDTCQLVCDLLMGKCKIKTYLCINHNVYLNTI